MIPLFKVLMKTTASQEVENVLYSGFTGEGKKCAEFEDKFQQLVDAPSKPLLVNSCTHALDLAYHLTLKRGDYVISTPMTCSATNMSLLHRGINIIWADVDQYTGNINPDDVEKKLGDPRIKAIITVDWSGRPCNYLALRILAHEYNIPIIHDAAHSLLAEYKNDSIAKRGGHFIAWSFQSIKTLSMADGGALMVPDSVYRSAKLLRWFGLDRESSASFRCEQDVINAGFKYQSNDVLAAIGIENMKLTKWAVDTHRDNALILHSELSTINGINVPDYDSGSSYWVFGFTVDKMDRGEMIKKLADEGISASEVHRRNDHLTCFSNYKTRLEGLDYFSEHQINIPCGWWVEEEQIYKIAQTVKKILA